MLAAASMPIVAGSSVHSTAARTARPHTPRCSMLAIMDVPESEDEHAVSMLIAGPACCNLCEGREKLQHICVGFLLSDT